MTQVLSFGKSRFKTQESLLIRLGTVLINSEITENWTTTVSSFYALAAQTLQFSWE